MDPAKCQAGFDEVIQRSVQCRVPKETCRQCGQCYDGIRTRRTLGEHLDTEAAKRWMGRFLGGILCCGVCPKTRVPRKRLDGELPEVVKWDGWTDSERRPRPGMPSTHWKPPCFFTVRAPAGVDALPQPPLRVKLAAALALFRDTKASGPIPAPDSFSISLVGGDAHHSSLGRARDLLSFWRSPSANKGRSLVPRSRQSRSNKSRPRSRSRSRSSHRLTRHFHCQQQRNKQKSPLSAHPRILSCLRGVAVSHAASILTAPPRRQDRAALFRASCRGPPEQQQRWGLLRRRYGDSPSSPAPSR